MSDGVYGAVEIMRTRSSKSGGRPCGERNVVPRIVAVPAREMEFSV